METIFFALSLQKKTNMKTLIFTIAILFSSLTYSNGQHFESSELGGYSYYNIQNSGFSNHVDISYKVNKNFNIGIVYEYNNWQSKMQSFGIMPCINVDKFFFGIIVGKSLMDNYTIDQNTRFYYTYKPSIEKEIYFGFHQKIKGNLSFKEEVSYSFSNLVETRHFDGGSYTFNKQPFNTSFILFGIAYRF